jgi:glycosyltransferase involved in cell wall biosynthesis
LQTFKLEPGGYLLWVGRLVPENDPLAFLEGVRQAGVESPAVVVGDSTYQDHYKAELRAAAPPNAVFTGFQFGTAYQQLSFHAGVFVLAASVGGTHPVLVEQMAAGNAILARDTESNREVLGEGGLFWQTAEELAALIRRVWPDMLLRRSLGDGARARAKERYSWEKVTDSYLELCAESLQRATER